MGLGCGLRTRVGFGAGLEGCDSSLPDLRDLFALTLRRYVAEYFISHACDGASSALQRTYIPWVASLLVAFTINIASLALQRSAVILPVRILSGTPGNSKHGRRPTH